MKRLVRTRALLTLLALVALFSSTTIALGASPAMALCSGSSCNGGNPNLGCATGAYDLEVTTYSTIQMQLRYSPTCNAVWTRLTSLAPCDGWTLPNALIRGFSTSSTPMSSLVYQTYGRPNGCGVGYVWWSPMAGGFNQYWWRACESYPGDPTTSFWCTSAH